MAFKFTKETIAEIEEVLGVKAKESANNYRFLLENKEEGRKLSLEIYPDIPIGTEEGNLITVYTPNAHLQLHFCIGFVKSDLLGEVTFIGEESGRLSGLIIEKGAGCSLYSNVDKRILSGDFTKLGPEVMLSGIALSLTEGVLEDK